MTDLDKRIAKKITKHSKVICRMYKGVRYYTDKYSMSQVDRARHVWFQHSPVGYTESLVNYARTLPESEGIKLLIHRWPELRRIILKETHNKQPTPEADLVCGQVGGVAEIGNLFSDQQYDFTISSLSYFSDRWCWSRVGRVDTFIKTLQENQ